MKTSDVLEWVAWGEEHFGSLVTNRHLRKRDMLRAVSEGLVESAGTVPECDGDGFTIYPERYREGYKLTAAGKAAVEKQNNGSEARPEGVGLG